MNKTKFDKDEYVQLLTDILPREISSKREVDRIKKIVRNLIKRRVITGAENELLGLLSLLLESYETATATFPNAPPHEMLKFLMEQRDVTPKQLAHLFSKSSGRVSEAMSGKRPLSKSQIKGLAKFFNVSVELFF